MCGRFTISTPADVVAEAFGLEAAVPLSPRYNVAPSQDVAVVRRRGDGRRELAFLRWGLIPSWAKDPAIGDRLINARAETAAEKPSFRAALRRRRCLVLADGFFEWAATSRGKQPYLIRFADRRPFGMAGLWETWSAAEGGSIESCTILTTSPNRVVAPLHDRMPVILPQPAHEQWLGAVEADPAGLAPLLVAHEPEGMIAFPVSRLVNNPANDGPDCVEPAVEA